MIRVSEGRCCDSIVSDDKAMQVSGEDVVAHSCMMIK